jgi:hypothetical protein
LNHTSHKAITALFVIIFGLIVLVSAAPSAITQAQSTVSTQTPGPAPSAVPNIEKIVADTGFRPAVNGFSFPNYGNKAGTENLTPADMQAIFGDQVCANLQNNICILKSPAQKKMDEVNNLMASGHCDGMAALSVLLYMQRENPQDFGASTTFGLQFTGNTKLQRTIARWYATQLIDPTYAAKLKFVSDKITPAQVIDLLISGITTKSETYTLSIFKPGYRDGHTITPFAVAVESSGLYHILVYDNNFPNETRYVEVDPTANTWKYSASVNPNVAQSLYTGSATTETLLLVPTSTRLKPQVCEFCLTATPSPADTIYNEIMFTTSSLINKATILVTDQQGHQLGYDAKGNFVNTIPGAYFVPVTSGGLAPVTNGDLWADSPQPELYIPAGIGITITVDGGALTKEETVSIALIGADYDLSVDEIILQPGASESLTISPDGQRLTYAPSSSEAPDITLGFDVNGLDYNFLVQGFDIDKGGSVDLALNPDKGQLAISTAGDKKTATYGLEVTRIDDASERTFTHDGISLEAGQTAYLDYAKWSGEGNLPIEIAEAGSSTSDQTIDESNQPPTAAPISNEPQNAALFSAVTYHQSAKSGTFSANSDGDYTLTLAGVALNTVYMVTSFDETKPPQSVTQISTSTFVATWKAGDSADTPIPVEAVLELNDRTVWLTLSEPAIDPVNNTLSYQVAVDEVMAVGSEDSTKLPDTFDAASLLISETHDLTAVLIAGLKTENVLTTGGQSNLTTGGQQNLTTGGQPNLTTGGQPNLTTGGQSNLTTGTTAVTGLIAWASRLAKQDTSPDPSQLTTDSVYSYYQTAGSGTLALIGNGVYRLNLVNVSPTTLSQSAVNDLGEIWLDSASWLKAWAASPVKVLAVLELPTVRLTLELSTPTSTTDSVIYTARLIGIVAIDGSTAVPAVPKKFDAVDLLIGNNSRLAAALTLGLNKQPLNLGTGGQSNLTTGGQQNLTTGGQPNLTTGGQPNLTTGGQQNLTTGGQSNITTGTSDINTNLDCPTAIKTLSTALTPYVDPVVIDDLNSRAIDVCPQSSDLTIPWARHLVVTTGTN